MAEAANTPLRDPDAKNKGDGVECAVCLQPCIHPAQLPCGHIFCFLCVKGFANQSKRCAMCRQEIPRDFIDQPHLLEIDATPDSPGFDGGYQWFYEGRNGWWQYDERTSQELEGSYKNGDKTSELLIAGFLYIIDLENMIQLRRNDPSRRRKIKRDNSAIPKKGIAGLRGVEEPIPTTRGPLEPRARPIEGRPEVVTPATPTTTPQSASISGRESPSAIQDVMQATVDRIHALSLEEQNHTINDLRNEYRERFVSMVHTNPRHNGAQ